MRRNTRVWSRAAALGAVVGSRSLLVPALFSRSLEPLAAAEMVADKTPWIPSRTAPASLAGRMLIGAAVGFGLASSRRRWRTGRSVATTRAGAALAGASFAAASAFLLRALRARVGARSRAGNVVAGLLEDLLAYQAGRALVGAR